jgi:hypothetical protein
MNIAEINKEIMYGNFTNDQLNSIGDAIKFARANLVRQTKRSLTIGSKVKFTSNRNGMTYTGTVDRIKIKFAVVTTPLGRYNVPVSMLETV